LILVFFGPFSKLTETIYKAPYFMAPEVFEEKYSSKADIWSIGCVAYQMAMGTPPWKSLGLSNPVSLFSHISKSTGPPEPFSVRPDTDISIIEENFHVEAFKKLVARCFERNPENRPEAKEILHDTLFKTVRTAACDDQSDCSRLFSPSSDRTFDSLASPSLGTSVSPIRPSPRRTHSIGSPMTPFLSPPLPRKMTKSRLSSPIISPIADPSEWPTWARNKHRGAIGAKEIIPKTNESRQSDSMMDSLNFSDDDYISLLDKSINPFLHSTDSSEKNLTSSMAQASLRGLQFVNSTSTADKKRDLDS
jgi:serine/threonine protein kinase